MDVIASREFMQVEIRDLLEHPEWIKMFSEEMSRTHKLVFMTTRRPTDGELVDVIGVVEKAVLRQFDLAGDFGGQTRTDVVVPAPLLLVNMMRVVVVLHKPELKGRTLLPSEREVDFVDFSAARMNVKDFTKKYTINVKNTQAFAEHIVQFLTSGKLPVILARI